MATPRTHSRWSAWWPLALLCVLGATRGMLAGVFPDSSTTLLSASTGCAAAALASLFATRILHLISKRAGAPRPDSRARTHRIPLEPRTLLAGALLLAGPLMGLLLTGHGINPNGLTLALALVPIVAAVAQNALGDAATGSFAARTWPALAALTGLLLLVPQPSFTNPVADTVLLLAPLATGIGAALFTTPATPRDQQPAFTSALSAAALLFAAAWLVHFSLYRTTVHLSSIAALLDAATAVLTFLALNRIGLTRWSAQFALIPLAVILQGFIFFRPTMDVYSVSGISLLLLGCIFLLLPQPSEKAF